MAKTNGKAKRIKLVEYDIGLLPVPPGAKRGKLTPEEAISWLEREHDSYGWLIELASRGDKATRSAGSSLNHGVGYMVSACAHVIKSGETIRLRSMLEGAPHYYQFDIVRWDPIRDAALLVAQAANPGISQEERDWASFAAHQIGHAVARWAAKQEALEKPLRDADEARCNEERRRARPENRSAALEAEIDELREQERKAAEGAAAPLTRRRRILEYEYSLIGHRAWGYKHPGDPPEGYEANERGEAA